MNIHFTPSPHFPPIFIHIIDFHNLLFIITHFIHRDQKTNMETNTYLTLTLNINFKFDSLMTEMLKVNVVFHM